MALTLLINSSYTLFLTSSFFITLLSLPKSTGVISNLSMPNLSKSHFKLTKSFLLVDFGASTLAGLS